MLIYRSAEEVFAIRVDTIDDMARIEEEKVGHADETGLWTPFLETEGVAEIEGHLVNVIKTVKLPVREAA
jgi:chemotaxis signal transduction protein